MKYFSAVACHGEWFLCHDGVRRRVISCYFDARFDQYAVVVED
jgi:hypothetical protein